MTLPFSLLAQREWSAAIGRKVALAYAFRDQERDDLVGVAIETLCHLYMRPAEGIWNEKRRRFDRLGFDVSKVPKGGDCEGAFRGWAYRWIKSECRRAADRLTNGGTYRTTRPENKPASVRLLGDDAEELEDEAEAEEPEAEEPEAPGPEPEPPAPATMTDDLDAKPYGRTFGRKRRH